MFEKQMDRPTAQRWFRVGELKLIFIVHDDNIFITPDYISLIGSQLIKSLEDFLQNMHTEVVRIGSSIKTVTICVCVCARARAWTEISALCPYF
jgi:hypothetical protein